MPVFCSGDTGLLASFPNRTTQVCAKVGEWMSAFKHTTQQMLYFCFIPLSAPSTEISDLTTRIIDETSNSADFLQSLQINFEVNFIVLYVMVLTYFLN